MKQLTYPKSLLMQMPKRLLLLLPVLLLCSVQTSRAGAGTLNASLVSDTDSIITGADQTSEYLPLLQGKRVAILANPSSIIGQESLVDSLLALGVQVVKVFGPEHGFRGNASNGAQVGNEVDAKTGIPIISLYGKKKSPSAQDLADVDVFIFDIQDVGCRFYTYINVLRNAMQSCATNHKPFIVLDRPNPNGYLVDGPILDMRLKSGIGQFPVPISYGMTIGEFARMINGEGWMGKGLHCDLKVITLKNYTHQTRYTLPVAPSPNLNTQQSILLYPTLCLFEGTIISQGRGTHFPFTVLGAPLLKGKYDFSFTPKGIQGMSEHPLHENNTCYGLDLRDYPVDSLEASGQLHLQWLIDLYEAYPDKARFFDRSQSSQMGNFDYLAGNYDLKQQIIRHTPIEKIRASWEPGLNAFKKIRSKYLLYP
ncbi:Uncharacterized conserved protein YbbC, DUF1343 family [Arachidicoccus rhizosphaerae]|uniref:Uncharacterized conserved protein YbbC, DUF1343 family n=1 Tax=Arachidicoccus rhizosphaerae TaxID=551991 RepID=A0A1H3VS22_9BACT|nr:DUF1343 domain-containing protein [Arachidicoccus rhizosphaerae]SDZ77613.1 Uncharacterized conserved protein YbbC, DUF1343 family [Arachidicoccus rhizosphaerae]